MQGVGGVRCHQRHQHHRRRRHHQHHQHHRLSKYLVKPLPGTWVPPWPMATLIGVASPHLVLLHGPTHALAVPAELQAGFLLLVAEERTAGRLAQASREFKQRLPQQPACSRFVKRAAWRRKPRWKPSVSRSGLLSSSSLKRSTMGLCTAAWHTQWLVARHVGGSFVLHAAARCMCSCSTYSSTILLSSARSCSHSSRCEDAVLWRGIRPRKLSICAGVRVRDCG